MARQRSGSMWLTLAAMLAASVGIHLVLWPVGDRILELRWGAPALPVRGGAMEVALLPSDAGEEEEPPDEPDQPEPESEPSPDGRIVKLDWLSKERPPEETEFLSEFDNRAENETRAPNSPRRPGATSRAQGNRSDAAQQPRGRRQGPASGQAVPLNQRLGKDERGEGQATDSQLAPATDGTIARAPGAAGAPGIAGLRGSQDAMRKVLGSAGSYDDLRGVEEGEETLLNSKRWRFASFFNRLRDAVAQHWHPEVIHAKRDPEGRVHGTKTRITRLRIRLNPDGSLSRIRIEQPSGVGYLDEEAIRAVRAAQPFNNPPPQLVDPSTGYIEFGFGFIFEIHGHGRIFRYKR